MNNNEFWKILDLLDWDKQGDEVIKPAIIYLSKKSEKEIFEFENIMSEYLYKLDSKKIAKTIYKKYEEFNPDYFLYQRCVALINGEEYYNDILSDRKKLKYDIWYESVLYIPKFAWEQKTKLSILQYPNLPKYSYETFSNKEGWK